MSHLDAVKKRETSSLARRGLRSFPDWKGSGIKKFFVSKKNISAELSESDFGRFRFFPLPADFFLSLASVPISVTL